MADARAGLAPSVDSLYVEARAHFVEGIRSSTSLVRTGTACVWEAILQYSFGTGDQDRLWPQSWSLASPSLRGTQLCAAEHRRLGQVLRRRRAPSWLQPSGSHLLHRLLEVLAQDTGVLRDGPCPACGGRLPLDAWHHVLVSCPGFPSRVPLACLPWLALGREFGLGYPLVAATAWYLPVLTAARDLLVVDTVEPSGAAGAPAEPGAGHVSPLRPGAFLPGLVELSHDLGTSAGAGSGTLDPL